MNNSTETEEILTCPLPQPAACTACLLPPPHIAIFNCYHSLVGVQLKLLKTNLSHTHALLWGIHNFQNRQLSKSFLLPFEKRLYSKRKEFDLCESKFFPFRLDTFSEEDGMQEFDLID